MAEGELSLNSPPCQWMGIDTEFGLIPLGYSCDPRRFDFGGGGSSSSSGSGTAVELGIHVLLACAALGSTWAGRWWGRPLTHPMYDIFARLKLFAHICGW